MNELTSLPWNDLAPFIAIGFMAQIIDGTVGMAFGVLSYGLLVATGLPPSSAMAAVRTAESFTSGVSGLSHALQRNIDWSLFGRLVIPGIIGGLAGVWLLTNLDAKLIRPIALVYFAAVGVYLVWRGPRRPQGFRHTRLVGPLGFVGGVLDASGGGGWGPIVTSNLLAQGANPRTAIGTANAAEFFVTVTVLAAFIGAMSVQSVTLATAGLVIGGAAAAPVGAWLVKRMSPGRLIILVGSTLIGIGLYGLLALIFVPAARCCQSNCTDHRMASSSLI